MTNPRRVQCGAPDCKRQYRNERQREFQRRYKAEHGNYHSRKYDKPRVKAHPIKCAQCGREATVTKADAQYCSHACFYDARYGVDRQPVITRTWISGRCLRCGDWYVAKNAGMGASYCSHRCRDRAHEARRRALMAGAEVDAVSRWRIHERDGWTCHICGDPVDRGAVVPDLAAPVLDHVVPLARGGSHSEANLKTAHFYCNSVKRDLVDGWSAVA